MKSKDLKSKLIELGWSLKRQGSNHEIWTNGKIDEQIPRHREINERLARKILRTAKTGTRRG